MLQRDLQQALHGRTLALRDRIAGMTRPLDPEQLVRRPLDGGWSVGHVLEHLCVTSELYEPPVRALLRGARPDAAAPLREWKPTLIGGFMARSFEKPTKLPSPKSMAPAASPRGGVLEAFLAHLDAQARLLDNASGHDWRRLRMASPAVPLPLKVFNLGDVFTILVVHGERHARQIERVVRGME
jgi:DinB superfamily